MSEFRFDKLRVPAELSLSAGQAVAGAFFVAGSALEHDGPERVADLLNARSGFFPFQRQEGGTALFNRDQLLFAALDPAVAEPQDTPAFEMATKRTVRLRLSNGAELAGLVPIYAPAGRDRLSDLARSPERFHYLVTPQRTLLVNTSHIVEITETAGDDRA